MTTTSSTGGSRLNVNSTGIFAPTRVFGEIMEKQRGGSIINISSIYGVVSPDLRAYGAEGDDFPPDYMFHRSGDNQLHPRDGDAVRPVRRPSQLRSVPAD